jgi:zinc finger FYVE domain-containing protein 26
VSIVVDLLHIDETSTQSLPNVLEMKLNSLLETATEGSNPENGQKVTPVQFVHRLLEVLKECLPSHGMELEDQNMNSTIPRGFTNRFALKAWELKVSNIQHFIEDWEWRLAVLQRLAPVSQRLWQWKEALAVLRAAPSTLLNM